MMPPPGAGFGLIGTGFVVGGAVGFLVAKGFEVSGCERTSPAPMVVIKAKKREVLCISRHACSKICSASHTLKSSGTKNGYFRAEEVMLDCLVVNVMSVNEDTACWSGRIAQIPLFSSHNQYNKIMDINRENVKSSLNYIRR